MKSLRESKHLMWVIVLSIIQHFIWGISLLISGVVPEATSMAVFFYLDPIPESIAVGLVCIGVSISASIGLFRKSSFENLLWVLPQQILISISAVAALEAIISECYFDGTIRSWEFIINDQSIYIGIAVTHTLALLDLYSHNMVSKLVYKFGRWLACLLG